MFFNVIAAQRISLVFTCQRRVEASSLYSLFIHFQSKEDINLFVVGLSIIEALYGFGVILFACELGQRVTDLFFGINGMIELKEWYLYSNKMQKMLLLVMIVAQQPVEFQCFGSTSANRDTFKNASAKCQNYYNMNI